MGDRYVNVMAQALLDDRLYSFRKCDRCALFPSEKESAWIYDDCFCSGKTETPCRYQNSAQSGGGYFNRVFYPREQPDTMDYATKYWKRPDMNDDEQEFDSKLYGHLVIIRNCVSPQKDTPREDAPRDTIDNNIEDGFSKDEDCISLILEGASGPATQGIARLITQSSLENDLYQSNLFYIIQKKLLTIHEADLYKKLDELETECSELDLSQHKEPVVEYLMSNLCNCFLPVVTNTFLEALKRRTWCFFHSLYNSDTAKVFHSMESTQLLYDTVVKWVNSIKMIRYTEAIVEINATSIYSKNHLTDSRKLGNIFICPDSIQII